MRPHRSLKSWGLNPDPTSDLSSPLLQLPAPAQDRNSTHNRFLSAAHSKGPKCPEKDTKHKCATALASRPGYVTQELQDTGRTNSPL